MQSLPIQRSSHRYLPIVHQTPSITPEKGLLLENQSGLSTLSVTFGVTQMMQVIDILRNITQYIYPERKK